MSPEPEVVQIGALVPTELADSLRDMAQARHRSVAAEIRLAVTAHVDRWQAPEKEQAA
jgi:hypothetical protein